MNGSRSFAMAVAALFSLAPFALAAPPSVNLSLSEVSHYYWRGYNVLGGATYPLQPSLTASTDNGLSANLWGSWALTDRAVYDSADEIDLTVSYSRSLMDGIAMSVGALYYYFPNNTTARTGEIYAGIVLSGAPFTPSLTVYYDSKWLDDGSVEADGLYVLAGAAQTIPIGRFALDLGAGLGLASNASFDGLQDLTLRAATTIPAGPVKITPFVTPVVVFQDKVNSETFNLAGGITVSYDF